MRICLSTQRTGGTSVDSGQMCSNLEPPCNYCSSPWLLRAYPDREQATASSKSQVDTMVVPMTWPLWLLRETARHAQRSTTVESKRYPNSTPRRYHHKSFADAVLLVGDGAAVPCESRQLGSDCAPICRPINCEMNPARAQDAKHMHFRLA